MPGLHRRPQGLEPGLADPELPIEHGDELTGVGDEVGLGVGPKQRPSEQRHHPFAVVEESVDDQVLAKDRLRVVLQPIATPRQPRLVAADHEIEDRRHHALVMMEAPRLVAGSFEPESTTSDRVFTRTERDRLDHPGAESYVDEPRLTAQIDRHDEVATEMIAPLPAFARNPADEARRVEPDLGQRPVHETVHLIAPAPTAAGHELVEDAIRVEVDALAELHVDVLVRDHDRVPPMQGPQGVEVDRDRSLVADTGQILVETRHRRSVARRGGMAARFVTFGLEPADNTQVNLPVATTTPRAAERETEPVSGGTPDPIASLAFRHSWRPSQKRVLDEVRLHLLDRRLHVVAAPGAGKTTLGLECFRLLGKPAVVLSPTRTIRNQWISRLDDFMPAGAAFPPEWVSTHIDDLRTFTSITYQALHTRHLIDQADIVADDDEPVDTVSDPLDDDEVSALAGRFRAAGVGTLILDEAHHLRAEWWKALTALLEQVDGLSLVSLTATPPYDAIPAEWQRYEELCGPVDEEISVPELVKAGTLCPHQDHVWTVVPIDAERQAIEAYEDAVELVITGLRDGSAFAADLTKHPWLAPDIDAADLLDDPRAAWSLHEVAVELGIDAAGLRGALDLPDEHTSHADISHWQGVIREYLFADRWPHDPDRDIRRDEVARRLRSHKLLHGRELRLESSRLVRSQLTQSAAKIGACAAIMHVERNERRADLRMVVLTDYIRDEAANLSDATTTLGAVPIFRRLAGTGSPTDLALLTGRVCVLPEAAVDQLRGRLDPSTTLDVRADPATPGYVRVHGPSTGELVRAITDLLDAGVVRVLVGTRALLGEGWDAPCINALVLASSVGSYMLTNQMRGRAIRAHAAQPQKVASIWHIVAFALDRPASVFGQRLRPVDFYLPGLADFAELSRRFDTFVGLDEHDGRIESGLTRMHLPYARPRRDRVTGDEHLELQREHFRSRESLERANEWAIQRRKGLGGVGAGWRTGLASAPVGRMVPEVRTDKPVRLVRHHLRHTIGLLLALAAGLAGMVFNAGAGIAASVEGGVFVLASLAAIAATWPLWKAARLTFRHLPIDGSVRQIGEVIADAMGAADVFTTPRHLVQVVAAPDAAGGAHIHLEGGTFRERSEFAVAVAEVLGEIDNPRYLVIRRGQNPWRRTVLDYHAVPFVLGVHKDRAALFAAAWKRRVGTSELIYTRTGEGRAILLRARTQNFASASRRATRRLERWI